jgi:hypothetical protein
MRSSAKRAAKRSRHPPEVRLHAIAQQLRNIAGRAQMSQNTRNKLHAIAHSIDERTDELVGEDAVQIKWTGAVIATPSQCICPTCGLRHGIESPEGGF